MLYVMVAGFLIMLQITRERAEELGIKMKKVGDEPTLESEFEVAQCFSNTFGNGQKKVTKSFAGH